VDDWACWYSSTILPTATVLSSSRRKQGQNPHDRLSRVAHKITDAATFEAG
jgi:hypothetical protein